MRAKPAKIATTLQPDDPLVQDADYSFDATDRQFIDTRQRAAEQHMADSLLNGVVCTWGDLDPGSVAVSVGDVVCSAATATGTVKAATHSAIIIAGSAAGVVLQAANPGAKVRYAVIGKLPPSITGLPSGSAGYARVNPGDGHIEYVSSFATDDYALGVVDTAGNMTLGITGANAIPLGAVASVSGTAPIVSSGGGTPAISITAATTTDAGSMSAADKTKLDGITDGAAVAAVTGTAPIVSSGGATPTISINAADGSNAGSMSSAHYTLVNGATNAATASKLAQRGASAECAFGWIAPALTSVATDGFVRTTQTAQTIVASASALTPGADLKSLYLAGGDVIGIGDGLCQGVNVQGTGFYFVDTSANSLLALDTNAAFANIGTFSVTAATAINLIGADVDVDTHKITSLATCTAGTDAANKDYVDGYKADVQVFTGAGASDWAKPTNGQRTLVIVKGGDGGGGSGQRGSVASTPISGGAGGGGAGISWAWLDTTALGATVTVTIGAKGAGGTAQTVDDTDGVAGGDGGTTTFGTHLQATGGGGGGGGATAGATGGAGGYGTFNGAPGASATAGAVGTVGPVTGLVPGGASGGGVAGGPVVHDGGAGSPATSIPGTQAAGGVAPGGSGGNGTSGGGAASGTPGMSGGGGASSSAAAGGAGGLAGTGGAGGSGGGAALNTFTSGAGSDGADGWAIAITLCA